MSDLLHINEGGVLTITLNRPALRNALSPEMKTDLLALMELEAAHPTCRAVLLRGAGGAFCSGADARPEEILARRGTIESELKTGMNRIVSLMAALPVPVVAAIQGPAAGAGVGLALAADLLLVAPSARMHLGFTRIGAVPDAGVTAKLAAKLGAARAATLTLLGEVVDANQALAWGLAARALPEDGFKAAAADFAATLATGPTHAFALTKKLLASASGLASAAQTHLDLEAALQAEAFASHDFEEGVRARAEKRKPNFIGR